MTRKSLAERVAGYIGEVDEHGCWPWTGTVDRKGYGRIKVGQSSQYAHRVVWELDGRDIPDGMTLDHLCRVRRCVRLEHMEVVTRRENTLRALALNFSETCRHGHRWDEHGVTTKQGSRLCMACHRRWDAAYRERRRATAASPAAT